MKKLYTLVAAMIGFSATLLAVHVPQDEARKLATTFYTHNAPGRISKATVKEAYVTTWQDVPTYYTFVFEPVGFVLVAADDASIPILGYSFESEMPRDITNPATKGWLDSYSKEIWNIITHNLSNKETIRKWNDLRNGDFPAPMRDVTPLLTSLWDQGCYYNTLCPADPSALWACGHTYTGCVATAMAQVMKYHNFPPQGVGSHSYTHPQYGVQSADFGNTTYDWASMPNSVGSNNTAVATLMYHAGVSVNMQYGVNGSGAYSEDVPYALLNYFNYQPGIVIKYKNDYPNVEDFKALLRADLDQQLPVYYSGQGTEGHAFVCDGYRLSDDKFHFNWGWSGSSNGYYAIGALNPGGTTFNDANSAVLHIKPYNPNLIVRISHPVNNAVIGVGYPVSIEAVTVRGSSLDMKLFIDGFEKFSTTNDTLEFTWNTSSSDLGSHEVKAYSYSATDTVFYSINLNVAEWISQASGFTATRGLSYMSAADSNSVWGAGFDPANPTGACSDFTRTTDGGNTWTPGVITNTTGLAPAMIFGITADKAYAPMYKVSGSKPQGIYVTEDGGATWSRQTTALFSNSASFPNCVHFFNPTDGWAMGDPISGDFEIYTTTDGGTTWTVVPGASIPNPVSGEFGVVGYYSAVNDTIWFGTNKGRVYHSPDKGHNWTVSTVGPLNGKYIKPTFRNGSHGLVQDKDAGTTGTICETFDGGDTWTQVTTTGPIYATDISYVPRTTNTWVSSGSTGTNGSSYSFDGGHTWSDFQGTQGAQYMQMTWLNNHCGWAGGVNAGATENGVYKFIGVLMLPLSAPVNCQASATGNVVTITWEAPSPINPGTTLMGYNMYRDGNKLNTSPITALTYVDNGVPAGEHNYCVTAIYDVGESSGCCKLVDVITSVRNLDNGSRLVVYPNPASGNLTVSAASAINDLKLYDHTGKIVLRQAAGSDRISIDISRLAPGLYTVTAITGEGIGRAKVVVR
jgi:photosystem II stability/assembly factor-like uncharacterized protein